MDYKKHYDQLIERGQGRLLEGYSEKHHIVPRCMGGTDDSANLVSLTAEEHYVAHQLLVKIYPGTQGLIFAAHRMTSAPNGRRNSNKLYGWLRKRAAEETSKIHKGKVVSKESRQKMSDAKKGKYTGKLNHFYGKSHSEETKAKLRKPKSEATKEKLRIAALNRAPMSNETKRKISAAGKGRIVSKESRLKSSLTQKGRPSPNKGKTYEELYGIETATELRKKRSIAMKKIRKNKCLDI